MRDKDLEKFWKDLYNRLDKPEREMNKALSELWQITNAVVLKEWGGGKIVTTGKPDDEE